jgi:hypothetical protein
MKILIVTMEGPGWCETEYIELVGDETDGDLRELAETAFFNRCNYGMQVVDDEVD